MTGDGSGITLAQEGHIAVLTIDRPERRNALDMGMIATLRDRCAEIEAAAGLRVVILTGTGRAFCAGGDIAAWSGLDAESFGQRWIRDGHDAFDALARLRLPVIAVLNGHALGGGLELAACADLRIAEAHVKLGQPEPGLGIVPGWSGTQRAVRRFGAQIVRRMVLFGEIFTAEAALAHGLVDRVVESGTGMDAAREVAQAVIDRAPYATSISKMMINAAEGEERERVLDALAGAAAAGSAELAEGLAAFRDKRKPKFT